MVSISEFLPNPVGADEAGEWIELWNSGTSPVFLRGWSLETQNGKKFYFQGESIPSNSPILLARAKTRLILRNTDEELSLYDSAGRLVDRLEMPGSAPEGKSFGHLGGESLFLMPTPREANAGPTFNLPDIPGGVLVSDGFSLGTVFLLAAVCGILLAGAVLYIRHHAEFYSDNFFQSNQKSRGTAG